METIVGIFAARDRAEEAVKELLQRQIPKESIIYLTRSQSEAENLGKELGAYAGGFVGGAAGLSAGVAAATLLAIPGIGAVFALGIGATALLGLMGAGTGAAVGGSAAHNSDAPAPTSGIQSSEDAEYFGRVLNEGHSLIVVRTESEKAAADACQILNQLGISMKRGSTQKSRVVTREFGEAIVVDIAGRIALADGTALVRDTIRQLAEQGKERIVLNMSGVDFIDSAGLGELVRAHASVRSRRGQLKIVNPSKQVHDLLRMTKLDQVLEIEPDEASALSSFGSNSTSSATA
jgi:anti-sigma B factor antagonist